MIQCHETAEQPIDPRGRGQESNIQLWPGIREDLCPYFLHSFMTYFLGRREIIYWYGYTTRTC